MLSVDTGSDRWGNVLDWKQRTDQSARHARRSTVWSYGRIDKRTRKYQAKGLERKTIGKLGLEHREKPRGECEVQLFARK